MEQPFHFKYESVGICVALFLHCSFFGIIRIFRRLHYRNVAHLQRIRKKQSTGFYLYGYCLGNNLLRRKDIHILKHQSPKQGAFHLSFIPDLQIYILPALVVSSIGNHNNQVLIFHKFFNQTWRNNFIFTPHIMDLRKMSKRLTIVLQIH